MQRKNNTTTGSSRKPHAAKSAGNGAAKSNGEGLFDPPPKSQQLLAEAMEIFHPEGHWPLIAIRKRDETIAAKDFVESSTRAADADEWAKQQVNNGFDVYFAINPIKRPIGRKANKSDLLEARWLQVDCDPPSGQQEIRGWQNETVDQLREGGALKMPPTVVIDSGRGFWAFWKVQEPVKLDVEGIARVEAANRGLREAFRGDSAQNVDRICRLPGYRNSKTGEVAKIVVYDPSSVYMLEDFPAESRWARDGADEFTYAKFIDDDEAKEAFERYLEKQEPAVQGSNGRTQTRDVLNRGMDFGLRLETAAGIMAASEWNKRCRPPWDLDELEHHFRGLANSRNDPLGSAHPEVTRQEWAAKAAKIAAKFFEPDAATADEAESQSQSEEGGPSGESDAPSDGDGQSGDGAQTNRKAHPIFDPWERYAVPAFPFDALPPDVARFVEAHSLIIGCDPSALAMCVMTAFSSALDHRFSLKLMRNGDFYASPRLWTLLVGDPSVKKTPMQNAALAPLRARENRIRDAYEKALAAHKAAGDKSEVEPPAPPRYTSNDSTVEKLGEMLARHDRGLLVARDEIAGWVGSMEKYASGRSGASDRAFWLQAYDGGSYTVDRIKRGELRIRNLSVSILGGIQPNRLAELYGLTSDGLLQRFLPVIAGSSRFPEDVDDDGSKSAYSRLVEQCLDAPPAKLRMTDAGLEAMRRLHRYIHDVEVSTGGFAEGFQGFVGKLAGVAGNLTLILHLIKADGPHIQAARAVDVETIEDVDRLIRDFILPHAFEFYRAGETATNGDRLQRIASFILTSGKSRIVASDLTSGVASLRGLSLAALNERMSPLVAGAWLGPEGAGPMNHAWKVNPRIAERFAERAAEEERRKQAVAELMNSGRRGRRGAN